MVPIVRRAALAAGWNFVGSAFRRFVLPLALSLAPILMFQECWEARLDEVIGVKLSFAYAFVCFAMLAFASWQNYRTCSSAISTAFGFGFTLVPLAVMFVSMACCGESCYLRDLQFDNAEFHCCVMVLGSIFYSCFVFTAMQAFKLTSLLRAACKPPAPVL